MEPALVQDVELQRAELEDMVRFTEVLTKENELFEMHLRRVNPQLLSDENVQNFGRKSQASKRGSQAMLMAEQKHDIAFSEHEEVKEELEGSRRNADKVGDTLKAQLEEVDVRIAEVKKDAYEFKRDIVTGAENLRTGKTIAEKAIRYMEDKLRAKAATAEKLRLKNTTLKAQIQKMESQLQQKEDMGEVLHVIDFDQLKIENQQYLEKIEERNNELLRLKLTTGNTVQVLNTLKHKLNTLTSESDWLKRETAGRKEALAKISEEISRVEGEKEQAARLNRKLQRETESESNMPQVLDYVAQKSEEYELQRQVAAWERKIEIADMEEKRYKMIAMKAGRAGA